jgi:hypothetical protein
MEYTFDIHKQVDSIYSENKNAFEVLEKIFLDAHSIPQEITKCAVKQRILGALKNEMNSNWLASPGSLIHNLALYISAMCYLLLCALLGLRHKRVNVYVDVDVLFDYYGYGVDAFYDNILKELPALNIGAFGPFVNDGNKNSCIPSSRKFLKKNRPYSCKAAWAVFKSHYNRFGVYWSLTKQTNMNFVDLALRLCSEVAIHKTSIEGISSKILVSANDNGYSPYRYHLYRSNGIGAIFLIQNGGRLGLTDFFNSYIHCDYYLGWSQERLDHFREMSCENKLAIGSTLLSNFLLSRNSTQTDIEYDIIFVEQHCVSTHQNHTQYFKLLQNLARYAMENPEIRVAYCRRPVMCALPSFCEQVNLILRDSPIIVLDSTNSYSSYEYIFKSSLLVSLHSSLRFEALMLGKPVISCCKQTDDFVVNYSDPCFVVSTDDYYEFASKINFMINNIEMPSVRSALTKLQKAVGGNIGKNVSYSIANLIKAELHY